MSITTPQPPAATIKQPSVSVADRHHTPQTAITHYVSEFSLSAKNGSQADAFSTATRLLTEWAKSKNHLPNYAIREERFGGDETAPEAWALHLQHREPRNDYRRYWHVDVSLQRRVGYFDVRVAVSHALDYSFVGWTPKAPDPSAPKFVYDWLAHGNLVLRSGQFAIARLSAIKAGGPTSLKERIGALKVSPSDAGLLARLIFDPLRSLPVVVIYGEVNPVTFPVNPHYLQQLLLGTCYVVWAPPASGWGAAWYEHFPKGFECRSNSVRLYQPTASKTTFGDSVRHRFFTEDEIRYQGGSTAFIAMIRDGLTRRLLAPRPGRIATCEDVLAFRISQDFAIHRSKLKANVDELALYNEEYQRLVEKNLLTDQLLQEADAELQSIKTELSALRPHTDELAAQLEAAKVEAQTAQPTFNNSDLLLRFFKNEAGVADQLQAISVLYPDAVYLLPSALRSAESADQFEHLDQLRELLFKLVTEYRQSLIDGNGNNEASRAFGRNNFTTKESDNLSNKGRIARTFEYQGNSLVMEQHLKIGVKDSEAHCLRLHFHWDSVSKKIVIGHCGKHLPL